MQTSDALQDRLAVILVRQLKLEVEPSFGPDVSLSDLGLDSLGMLAFIASLEREFDVSISDEDYETLDTFGDALTLVGRLTRGE